MQYLPTVLQLNELESISKSSLINSKGEAYEHFKGTLRPSYGTIARDLAFGVAALLLIMVSIGWLETHYPNIIWILIPLGSLAIGIAFSYLQLFLHEGAHYNLLPDRTFNDLFTTWCIGVWVGTSVAEYRTVHWEHHRHLGTTADPERSYFQAPTLRFLIECITGIHLLRIATERSKHNSSLSVYKSAAFLLHAAILTGCILAGYWALAICWIIAVVIVYPFFAALRQLLEHRSEKADPSVDYAKYDHGAESRLFTHNFLSHIFGAAGFEYHLLHHWEPTISYTCLPKLEEFLLDTPQCNDLSKRRASYPTVFLRLFFGK